MVEIGEAIKSRRQGKGLTLDGLAGRSGVSRAMLSEIERGVKNPTIRVVCQIADIAAIPRSTVREWLRRPHDPTWLHGEQSLGPGSLPAGAYSYLLGFYLGDGCLSRSRRDVYRLRIATDARYPGVIRECVDAMQAVMPGNRVAVKRLPSRAVEISCYSKRWPLLL